MLTFDDTKFVEKKKKIFLCASAMNYERLQSYILKAMNYRKYVVAN